MPTLLHLIPTLEGGGAERQLAMLAVEQAKRGWNVHIGRRRGGVHEKLVQHHNVKIHSLGDLKSIHPLLVSRTNKLMKSIRPDIVQTWLPQMDIVGGLSALWNSIPWVISERSCEDLYQRTLDLIWLRRRLGRYARSIISNSKEGTEYWQGVLPSHRSVIFINNAVDIKSIQSAEPTSCLTSGNSNKTFLCVGRFEHYKAQDIFLQAISEISRKYEVRAFLIGGGPLLQSLVDSVSTLKLQDRVTIMPYQSNWWGLLKTSTALVSPSRLEGQPNVVLEAMAAGCPLIVSDIAAHRAILDDTSALIVPTNDFIALASAMTALISDKEAARKRVERAYERVAEFTIPACVDAHERVYAPVLEVGV